STSISAIEIEDQDSDYDVLLTFMNATEVVFGDVPVQHLVAPVATNIELNYDGTLEQFVSAQYALYVLAPKAETLTVGAKETNGSAVVMVLLVLILHWPFDNTDTSDFNDLGIFIDSTHDVDFTISQSYKSNICFTNFHIVTAHIFVGS